MGENLHTYVTAFVSKGTGRVRVLPPSPDGPYAGLLIGTSVGSPAVIVHADKGDVDFWSALADQAHALAQDARKETGEQ